MNLESLQMVKERWMSVENKTKNDTPSWNDLQPFMEFYFFSGRTNGMVACPEGGTYSLGRVGEPPRCSISGRRHTLPE